MKNSELEQRLKECNYRLSKMDERIKRLEEENEQLLHKLDEIQKMLYKLREHLLQKTKEKKCIPLLWKEGKSQKAGGAWPGVKTLNNMPIILAASHVEKDM